MKYIVHIMSTIWRGLSALSSPWRKQTLEICSISASASASLWGRNYFLYAYRGANLDPVQIKLLDAAANRFWIQFPCSCHSGHRQDDWTTWLSEQKLGCTWHVLLCYCCCLLFLYYLQSNRIRMKRAFGIIGKEYKT